MEEKKEQKEIRNGRKKLMGVGWGEGAKETEREKFM